MAKRSAASLSVVPVVALARVDMPGGLTDAEAALWRAVVDSKPADWFGDDSAPLLVEYVRAKTTCDALDRLVKAALDDDAQDLKSALHARDIEAKRLLSIGTKLRLTQQSRYTPKAAATAQRGVGGKRPWQVGG